MIIRLLGRSMVSHSASCTLIGVRMATSTLHPAVCKIRRTALFDAPGKRYGDHRARRQGQTVGSAGPSTLPRPLSAGARGPTALPRIAQVGSDGGQGPR